MQLELWKKDKIIKIFEKEYKITRKDIIKVLKLFSKNFEIKKDLMPLEIYYYLVKLLFLDPVQGILRPQSKLTWYALKEALKELKAI